MLIDVYPQLATLLEKTSNCFCRNQSSSSTQCLSLACVWLALTLLSAKGHFFSLTDELLAESSGLNIVGIKSVVIDIFFLILITSCRACGCSSAQLSSAVPCWWMQLTRGGWPSISQPLSE